MVESTPPIRRVPDAALIQQLAQQEGLVRWVGRQQWRGPLSFEDARHAGRIGLGHALRRYDPARGLRFSTSAVPAIARTVWQEVGIPPAESRATVPPPTDPIEQTDPREALHQAQVVQALPALIAMLPERLRAVDVWHYGWTAPSPRRSPRSATTGASVASGFSSSTARPSSCLASRPFPARCGP